MPAICQASEPLGVLVCERSGETPFAESSFLRELTRAGERIGLPVFAFAPWTWRPDDRTVRGWFWQESAGRWISDRTRLPTLLYDRSWPSDASEGRKFRGGMQTIVRDHRFVLLNGRLPDKKRVHEIVSGDERIAELLPPTALYRGPAAWIAWLHEQGGAAILKPAAGSQGRRIAACLLRSDGSVRIRGRRDDNKLFERTCESVSEAAERLSRWIGGRSYLMQPYLDLRGPDDEPFDIRALLQKDARGRWTVTGTAVRRGRPGAVTANLHGGGSAVPAQELLAQLFGTCGAAELLRKIRDSCRSIVIRLERHFGRFAELGLDFGIDRSGKLWFLEANAKPGRASMNCLGRRAAAAAAAKPAAYARSILLRPSGRVLHEFDHL